MGERYNVARLSRAAPSTKNAQAKATKIAANFCESSPAVMARVAVRGFAASMRASAMRLNAMAADRAETMQSTIQPSLAAVGMPPAASMAAHRANGSAKIECSHLIISSVVLMLVRRGTEYFILALGHWLLAFSRRFCGIGDPGSMIHNANQIFPKNS